MSDSASGTRHAEGAVTRVLKGVLIALILSFVVGAPSAELWLRRHLHPADQPKHVFLRAPLRRTLVAVSRDVPGLGQRETLFTTNSLGVRGDELDLTQHEAFRVMTLGGSVTECMVLSDDDAWPHQLQTQLATRTGRPIWVGNAGRSGEMTLDYIAHAQVLLPAFEPDMVVVMPGGNDLQAAVENRYFPIDLTQPKALSEYASRLYARGDTLLLEPFYAYYMLERYLETEYEDLGPLYAAMKARRFAAKKLPSIPDFEDAIDIYRGNLRTLHKSLSRLRGAPKVVLVTHPFLWHDGMSRAEEQALWAGYTCLTCPTQQFYTHQALAAALGQMNQELLKLCAEHSLSCFDLEAKVPKTLDHFYDDGHLTERGAQLVATLLSAFIAERGLGAR